MGRAAPGHPDVRRAGTHTVLSGLGSTAWIDLPGPFWVMVRGTFVATLVVEVSFEGGASGTAVPLLLSNGTPLSITAPMAMVLEQPETNVQVRVTCTAYTSGTMVVRLSA